MKPLQCLRYVPLILMLLLAAWVAFVCMGNESNYSNSTFVFSDQGQV